MVSRPFVIGLTGSLGMGKTATARLFAQENVPVFDADQTVHDLYAGPAAAMIEAAFPGSTQNGAVNRAALAAIVTHDPSALARLESLVHPLVAQARDLFIQGAISDIVVLDVPLLLETGISCDAVVVVTAPLEVQRARVLARPGMTAEKFEALSARQMPDAQKRAQAAYLITTDKGLDDAREQVKSILADIRKNRLA